MFSYYHKPEEMGKALGRSRDPPGLEKAKVKVYSYPICVKCSVLFLEPAADSRVQTGHCFYMNIKENSFWYKLRKKLVPVLLVLVVAALIWVAFGNKIPGLIPLLEEGNSQKIADYLAEETGIKGIIAVMILQAIQVISIVMPGMAIQVAAGLMYGWLEGFVVCYAGFVIANALVFMFARRMGSDRLRTVSMGRGSQWFLERFHATPPMFMVGIANLIPAIPNGIIPYIAAKTKISTRDYTLAVASTSWIQILTSCVAGQFIIRGKWEFTIMAIAFQCLIIGFALWKKDWILNRLQKR